MDYQHMGYKIEFEVIKIFDQNESKVITDNFAKHA